MRSVEKTAKTVDEAVQLALDTLETTRENVTVKVIEETKAKLFGLLGKDSVTVKVSKKEKTAEELVSSMFKDYKTQDQLEAEAKNKRELAKKAKYEAELAEKEAQEKAKIEEIKKKEELDKAKATSEAKAIVVEEETKQEIKEEIKPEQEKEKKDLVIEKATKSKKLNARSKNNEEKIVVNNNKRMYVYSEEATEKAKNFLKKIIETMKLDVVIEKFIDKQDNSVTFKLHAPELGIMIGKHGKTLDSLQYLTNLIANHGLEERVRIIVDVEDYRERREETLIRLANRLAEKVKKSGEKVELEPMNPRERKIIHMALQNSNKVVTGSDGVEPKRFVVIYPKQTRKFKKIN